MSEMFDIKELIEKLNRYRNAYYNENRSLVSDKEYDELYDELVKFERETGVVFSNSPTQTVGYEVVSKLNKVTHNHPLLSLDKTTEIDEFSNFFGNHEFVIMGKMDGLTASLLYRNGKLVSAESRGNGEVGEDITHNVKVFDNIPLTIPFKDELIVDGECIITYDEFDRINKREHTEYKNPRNLVSGTVRQLDSEVAAQRHVKFIAWKLYSIKDKKFNAIQDGFDILESFGFTIVPHFTIPSGANTDYLMVNVNCIKGICANFKYPIDGIVGIFNNIEYGNSLGSTGHHPKHSLAFKFYQERNETTLLDVEWNTSRTGMVNPVAIVEPVEIDGTTVCRATLNNVSIIEELELGIGDTLTIIKANQIIPMITENLTKSNTYKIPKICPSCGQPLVSRNETGRKMLYCVNSNCPAIRHDRIANFASREAMNIVGISEERLKILMDNGYIVDFPSVYSLYKFKDLLIKMDGFGKSSVENILTAIEESKKCKFSNLLVALGIPGVGKSTAKSIAKYCQSNKDNGSIFQTFIDMSINKNDWSILEDFGKTTSEAINNYIEKNLNEIQPLVSILTIEEDSSDAESINIFGGDSFCVTGKLIHYENRDKLVEDIEKYGGKIVSGVTSKTNYLITNDVNSGSSKNEKAKKFGTKIITESDFIDMIFGLN